MKAKISEAEELQLPMFYLDDNKNIVKTYITLLIITLENISMRLEMKSALRRIRSVIL